ncbi:MAG: RluA family pseudouridine synthase [Acetanaerobacterium sp.]
MSRTERYLVAEEYVQARLDAFMRAVVPDLSRSQAQKLIDGRMVTVNGMSQSKNYKLAADDAVLVRFLDAVPPQALPEDIPLNIMYEDDDLIVVNKPKDMVVHPAAGNYSGTLVNALLYHCGSSLSGINGVARPGIVHRIDKDTSGLLMVAKNDHAHKSLAAQIKEHSFVREYETVVYGRLAHDVGSIDAPIGRHPVHRKKMAVTEKNSKIAVTHYRVLERYSGFTHVAVRLETGRTHQIRVHMAYIGHPVAGDTVYGPGKPIKELCGQCLHAKILGFVHPTTGDWMIFESELPEYFVQFLNKLRG